MLLCIHGVSSSRGVTTRALCVTTDTVCVVLHTIHPLYALVPYWCTSGSMHTIIPSVVLVLVEVYLLLVVVLMLSHIVSVV